jgi:DNA polymerase delta subunit 1
MIEATKQKVESEFTVAKGFAHNAEVIYGDTDSVMVKFGCSDLKTAMDLGKIACLPRSIIHTDEAKSRRSKGC